jgi:hypothetical protein
MGRRGEDEEAVVARTTVQTRRRKKNATLTAACRRRLTKCKPSGPGPHRARVAAITIHATGS